MSKVVGCVLLILSVLVAASLACSAFGGGEPEAPPVAENLPDEEPTMPAEPENDTTQPTVPATESKGEEGAMPFDTDFPLPDDVQNFMLVPQSEAGINFQTSMNLEDVVAFYRGEFTSQGLVERELLTVIEESAFSMVFDGAPNGKAIVIQGVALGPDQTNVNIRYEDV